MLAVLALAAMAAGDDWPAFRGGALAGVPAGKAHPAEWDTKKNIKWSVELPPGWSSPIVVKDRVFVTAAKSGARQPAVRKGLYIEDLNGKKPPGEHEWQVLCLDAATGKELWRKTPFKGKMPGTVHIKNSLASETPASDGERVYSVFGNVGIACHDLEGKELWTRKLPARKTQMGWGTGASPALCEGKLILVDDNEEASSIEALDAKTGEPVWKTKRKETSNWATPFVWKNDKRTEIVTAGKGKVRSYSSEGKELWELGGMSTIAIPTPFAAHGLLYVSSGYVMDFFNKPVYAIKPGAKGDISLKDDATSNDWIAWRQRHAGAYHPTPLVLGDHLYVLHDRGFLACYDARTGKEAYGKKRLGSASFTASPWANGKDVCCLSEDGETWVIQGGKEFKILRRNKLEGMSLASPAVSAGRLYVRTQDKLWCVAE
ncbi:MAG: PQQ-binding-like beta-propeller repeat protein [Gemmataceae bacterium]|nr:PQQ-binding-like beta-propeller repeat protein [Gemmataceae bacterium]